jgi:GTP-binding protein
MSLKGHDAHLIISCASLAQFPPNDRHEVVMVGKSNVGKSSLINALTGRKNLAYVGARPGKTRLANFFHISDELMLVDVPGYGFANRSKAEQIAFGQLMDDYFGTRKLTAMLLCVDARRGLNSDDELIIELARQQRIRFAIILTKIDKLTQRELSLMKQSLSGYLFFTFTALKKNSVNEISEQILRWCEH